jgi:hypothetical protein
LPGNLILKFNHHFENEIWKIVYDQQQHLLALELRNKEEKEVFIHSIDLDTGKFIGEQVLSPTWLSNLVGVLGSHYVIQKYKTGSFPEPKGWYLISSKGNNIELESADGSIAFISGLRIYYTKVMFEQIIMEAYDTGLGKFISIESIDDGQPENVETNINIPQQYSEGLEHFNTVKNFIGKKTKKEITGLCEYYETGSKIVVSYYIRGAEKLENYLLVSDEKGKLLMDNLINSNISDFKKDTFFVIENQLIFVKDKKEIASYVL